MDFMCDVHAVFHESGLQSFHIVYQKCHVLGADGLQVGIRHQAIFRDLLRIIVNSALLLSASFVGVFITPVLTSLTAKITGSESVTYRFVMVAIVAIVLAVLTVVLKKKK